MEFRAGEFLPPPQVLFVRGGIDKSISSHERRLSIVMYSTCVRRIRAIRAILEEAIYARECLLSVLAHVSSWSNIITRSFSIWLYSQIVKI